MLSLWVGRLPIPFAHPGLLGLLGLGALLFSPSAWAHYPHDVAHWAAVSPDPEQPLWLTSLERINVDLLGRSEDGLSWDARLVPASADGAGVKSGVLLTPERLAVATQAAGLQISEDAGDDFERELDVTDDAIARVVASPAVLDDGLAFAAGETRIWRTDDGGLSWEAALEALDDGFSELDVSPDFAEDGRVCAVDGAWLACSEDHGERWTWSTAPSDTYRLSVGASGRVWAAVRGGGLYGSSDMGIAWSLVGFDGQDVTAIAELEGELVMLALAQEAAWRSVDAGESWERVEIVEIPFDQSVDGVNFFDFLEGPDGVVYSTSWFGLARSEDRGVSFEFFDTERIENTHSISLTEGPDGEIWAWIGTYGGGPVLTEIRGQRAYDFGALRGRFTRNTPVSASWLRDGVGLFDEGYDTYRTLDGGQSWEAFDEVSHEGGPSLDNDVKGVAIAPDVGEDPFVLLNVGQGAMSFLVSEDLGESWTVGSQEPACEDLGLAAVLSPRWPDDARAWASCHGVVYETSDRGAHWEAIGDTDSFVFDLAEQPHGALLVAARDGLWRMDGELTERVAFEGQLVMSVATPADGQDDTVFVLVPTEGWLRSDDGAASWTELSAPTTDFPRMISLSPRFSKDGIVAVAGYGGAWASVDRGDSWFAIHALDVYECDHDAWKTTGEWRRVSRADASGQRVVTTQEVGATRSLDFEGIDLVLTAPTDAEEGVVDVSLDGGAVERISLPAPDGVVWQEEGLDDGWHRLSLEAVSGTVTLDSLRIARLPGADAGSLDGSEGCSCRDRGRDTGLAALVLLPLAWRRRRREEGP